MRGSSTLQTLDFSMAPRPQCPIIKAWVKGLRRPLKVLLDSGAEDNFITSRLINTVRASQSFAQVELDAKTMPLDKPISVDGITGTFSSKQGAVMKLRLRSEQSSPTRTLAFMEVPAIESGHVQCDLIFGMSD